MPAGGLIGRGRRRIALAVVVGAVIAGAAIALVARTGDDGRDDRAGSVRLEDAPALFETSEMPESYRIDYRVESHAGDDVVLTSDRLTVRRPFASRLETFDGPEPDGAPSSVQVAAFGALLARGAGAAEVVVAVPPGPATSDALVAVALEEALADGRFELGERREVLERTCQVLRSATLLASGDLAPPGDGDHADTCVDDRGLVLEELLVVDGELLLRRVAVDVEIEPDLGADAFEIGDQTVPADEGGGFLAELVPGSRQPGTFFEPTVPAGFERNGRFVVIPPQQERFTDPTQRGDRLTYVSDVFVDGPAVVVLDQGGTLGGVEPFPDLGGVPVDIDGLGPGTRSYGSAGAVLVVPRDGGKFLRARGSVPPDVIVALLESLVEVEGGELTLLGDS